MKRPVNGVEPLDYIVQSHTVKAPNTKKLLTKDLELNTDPKEQKLVTNQSLNPSDTAALGIG